jgi:hypothetical protein
MPTRSCSGLVKLLLSALIALGLLIAPISLSGTAMAATDEMTVSTNCPEKRECCDKSTPDCAVSPSCLAKCGGLSGMTLEAGNWLPELSGGLPAGRTHVPAGFSTPPPKRPPRA